MDEGGNSTFVDKTVRTSSDDNVENNFMKETKDSSISQSLPSATINTSDTSLITFKAISNFINELGDIFDDKQRTLKLYHHLISKTTLSHDRAIQNHISAFLTFCKNNRDAILSKDKRKLDSKIIKYSDRVYINMDDILRMSDSETEDAIWNHLLTISALVDPAGRARHVLQENMSKKGLCDDKEADFLSTIINKVEEHVDPNANPMEAISSIMKSGVFNDLVGGMGNGLQNGSLDLSKLMSTVQTLVSSMGVDGLGGEGGGGGSDPTMNMINSMMSNMMTGMNQPNAGSSGGGSEQDVMNSHITNFFSDALKQLPSHGKECNESGTSGGMPNLDDMMKK